ncbi:MAG: CPBP family intramembrane metalloprotease [Candidatus Moranbacteria bacterium]|nr:CPBP family intramembrane metalloprotease [Candidatus Moranbacteria bacterium]
MKQWLLQEPSPLRVILIVLATMIIDFSYLKFLSLKVPFFKTSKLSMKIVGVKALPVTYMILIFILACIEEMLFRLPLVIVVSPGSSPYLILALAVLLSIGFGFAHGDPNNILCQGVMGFLYCLVFLSCGGLSQHYGTALMISTITHFLHNAVVDMLVCENEKTVTT